MIETTLKLFSYDRYHPYVNIKLDTFVDNILFVRDAHILINSNMSCIKHFPKIT